MTKRPRRTFTDEFKNQMVQLYLNGKPRTEIVREYDLTASSLDKWIKQHQTSGSFNEKDNRSEEETELIRLRRENQRLLMENDIPKASRADNGTKVEVIKANQDRYSISAMCDVLGIPKSTFYHTSKKTAEPDPIINDVIEIFKSSRRNYGTRKIKYELKDRGIIASRRRIGRIMKENGLVSNYAVAQYKVYKQPVNDDSFPNEVNQQFDGRNHLEVIVSDLTYVRVGGKWNYVCLIIDLHNREIIGYSAGANKTALLVYQAFARIKYRLDLITIFHTDRGSEFKNNAIDGVMETFNIRRSLSKKGCPYDNAVAESTFKVFKTEFANQQVFPSLDYLKLMLSDYVNWYNNVRIHSSLSYLTPVAYRKSAHKKVV
ncbi:MAG: IS3 family transposase [Acetobacterium woodii]|nr:IS3 family transposase [Acetobacterium woodii]